MTLKQFLIICMFLLIAFYSYCLYLSINPRVGDAYRLYYIDRISKSPHIDLFSYTLGEKALTSSTSYGSKYLGKGWSIPEEMCTWSGQKNAYLLLAIDNQPVTDLELIVKVQGAIHPKHPRQIANIYVNNIYMEKWEFTSDKVIEKRLAIPKEILTKNNLLIITIISEDHISPYKLGLSDDKRKLGICLHWLQINSADN